MPAVLVGIIVVLAVVLVTMSFGRPGIEAYVPTPPNPSEAGETLVGPIDYTVDATSTGAWQFFDFSRGSVVADPGPGEWDLAFRRFHIIANGGPGFSGEGGIIRLEETDLDAVSELPEAPYVETRGAARFGQRRHRTLVCLRLDKPPPDAASRRLCGPDGRRPLCQAAACGDTTARAPSPDA